MIQIQSFTFGVFQENTYLLFDETRECIIIDPGCYEDEEKKELVDFIGKQQLKVVKLLNTHCHIDHVLGNEFVKSEFGVELFAHEIEVPYLRAVKTYAPNYGYSGYSDSEIDQYITEGDVINFGASGLSVLFVPGHSAGHVAFFHKDQKFLIGGDVLFRGSIGRTDLPGGDFDTLINSIRSKVFPLGDDVTIYAGHGLETTIKEEKSSNPFCGLHLLK